MNKKKYKKFFGFSLIEVMIALIVIAVLSAVMVPNITKKLESKARKVKIQLQEISTKCSEFGTQNGCKLCTNDKCLTCFLNCSGNQAKINSTCTCENCVDRYSDSQCSACNETKCLACNAGYYLNDENKCTQCPIGYYCVGGNHDKKECEEGTYQNQIGQTGCIVCPNGTYQNESGQASCIECPNGTYQNQTGQVSCISCTGKNYQSGEERTKCYTCEKGFYASMQSSDDQGNTTCLSCLSNCINCTSATSCIECNAGYYLSNNQCLDCPVGHYCLEGSNPPIPCPVGTYQGETRQSSCVACDSGYIPNNSADGCQTCSNKFPNCALCTSTACTACKTNYYLSNNNCLSCGDGYYSDGTSSCSSCSSNCKTCSGTDTTCTSCNSGYYLSGSSCLSCDTNCKTCSSTDTTCTSCNSGYYLSGSSCLSCSDKFTGCSECDKNSCSKCSSGLAPVNGSCAAYQVTIGGTTYTCSEEPTSFYYLSCKQNGAKVSSRADEVFYTYDDNVTGTISCTTTPDTDNYAQCYGSKNYSSTYECGYYIKGSKMTTNTTIDLTAYLAHGVYYPDENSCDICRISGLYRCGSCHTFSGNTNVCLYYEDGCVAYQKYCKLATGYYCASTGLRTSSPWTLTGG